MINSILVLTVPFIFVIVITWLKSNEKLKRNQLEAELYVKAIEKGQPVPANLFADEKKQDKPLNTGVVLISVSVGIILSLWLLFEAIAKSVNTEETAFLPKLALVGFIPFMAGVAFVIIHFIGKNKSTTENAK